MITYKNHRDTCIGNKSIDSINKSGENNNNIVTVVSSMYIHDVVFHRKITPFETQHKYVCLITCSRIEEQTEMQI